LLGLVTLAFLVGAVKLDPPLADVAKGLVPRWPHAEPARYWFLAVSILGASLTPYLFYFYSSGAVEDAWTEDHLRINRVVATLGMSFGGVLAMAVLVVAAMVFAPRGIAADGYEQIRTMLDDPFPRWGFLLFAASLAIACFGAAMEITLALAYLIAQGSGWTWGKNRPPRTAARFSVAYTLILVLGAVVVLTGLDPLTLTNVSMALTAATLPLAVLPFVIVMNDRAYLGEHTNGWAGNVVVVFTVLLACLLAIVSIPLQFFGS
jgi:Mn2+/Fe2+ NRAMP family transporter